MFLNKDNHIKWKALSVALMITLAVCLLGIFWFDKPVYLFLRHFNWSGWGVIDSIFSTEMWLITSLAFAVGFFLGHTLTARRQRRDSKTPFNLRHCIINFINQAKDNYGLLVFASVFFASVIAGVLKIVLGRARPIFFEALNQTGFYPFTADWAFNSMPSGHTVASFAGLVMIGLLFPKIKWATWTVAIIIGLSRISYGAHWPTDVILAAFIGMASADIVKSFFMTYKNK